MVSLCCQYHALDFGGIDNRTFLAWIRKHGYSDHYKYYKYLVIRLIPILILLKASMIEPYFEVNMYVRIYF